MKKFGALLAALMVSFGCFAGSVAAQEVQVPLDERGQVLEVDGELASRVGLFTEYSGFREARLFRSADESYVLIIRYNREGEVVQVRQGLSTADVAALRRQVSERITADVIQPRLDQEGRVRLLRVAGAMSLLAYGPSLVAVLGIEEEAAGATISLGAGAAGFFVPYYITRNLPVSRATASLTSNASVLGYLHGVALAAAVGGEDVSPEAVAGAGLAVSLGEALLAYRLASSTNMTEGSASMMLSGGIFGAGIGLGVAAAAIGEGFDDESTAIRVVSATSLFGSALGAAAGYGLSKVEPYTRGDARVLSTAGIIGTYTAASFGNILDVENVRSGALLGLAGTSAGLVAGRMLTRNRDFTRSQGNYLALGSMAGGLVGLAVASAVGADETVSVSLGTLGSAAGFGVMYHGFAADAGRASRGSLEFSMLPSSSFTGAMKTQSSLPIVRLRATF